MQSLRFGASRLIRLRNNRLPLSKARFILSSSSGQHAVNLRPSAQRFAFFSQSTKRLQSTERADSRSESEETVQLIATKLPEGTPAIEEHGPVESGKGTKPSEAAHDNELKVDPAELPLLCPGCGAYSQTTDSKAPGYYNANRNDVQLWLAKRFNIQSQEDQETDIVAQSLASADPELLRSLGISTPSLTPKQTKANTTPICGRCHALIHQNDFTQSSIVHPSIDAVRTLLAESPYKRNHIYHVIDAADFPMSLIPNISTFFDIAMRSKNRRAKSQNWSGGVSNQMSFIITRADLIAHDKRDLDKMMPYLQSVLRDALGKHGESVRLGNLWCVSARQGWWTKDLKEEVYKRGNCGWLVGKVNVGKSQLYEAIFPKGRGEIKDIKEGAETSLDHSNPLLPPLRKEENFPAMPTISQLPGTTALPVRNLFGNGRGELIDLPGLPRDGLYEAVNPETAPYFYHGRRISAEQFTIQPGRSLLVSNLVSIRCTDPELTVLAAAFVPQKCSVRDNDFAVSVLNQTRIATIPQNIARNTASAETASTIASAGTFKLSWDITKERAGPLTRRDAAALKPDVLPFKVFGADILLEGVGWIELTCQVRKRYIEEQDETWRPEVEVMSPHGKYIGFRRPMNAYLSIGDRRKVKSQRSQRPRRSMKGVKKEGKRIAREQRRLSAAGDA